MPVNLDTVLACFSSLLTILLSGYVFFFRWTVGRWEAVLEGLLKSTQDHAVRFAVYDQNAIHTGRDLEELKLGVKEINRKLDRSLNTPPSGP